MTKDDTKSTTYCEMEFPAVSTKSQKPMEFSAKSLKIIGFLFVKLFIFYMYPFCIFYILPFLLLKILLKFRSPISRYVAWRLLFI